MIAVRFGWLEGVELLLDAGADVILRDNKGWNVLTWAQYLESISEMADMVDRLELAGAE